MNGCYIYFSGRILCPNFQLLHPAIEFIHGDQGRSQDSRCRVGFPASIAHVRNYARLRTGVYSRRRWLRARLRVLGGRRSGFGRHSGMRRLIVMHLLVAATGATVPLPFSTLITGSLRYKAERGQALHLSPGNAARKCPRSRARSN